MICQQTVIEDENISKKKMKNMMEKEGTWLGEKMEGRKRKEVYMKRKGDMKKEKKK
jgi:hypothetical protein